MNKLDSLFKKNERILIILECLLTFLFCVIFVFNRNMIIMSADEMGPIAVAAYWNGYDWSEVMSHGAYYSYGYSIILFPLLLFFKTPESFYKSAMVVNALFSALMTFFSWKTAKELRADSKPVLRLAISFFCGVSLVNISRSPSAWAEVYLAFLCWVLTYLMIKIIKTGKIAYYILGALVQVFLYITHQRTVGIFVIALVCVLYVSLIQNKRIAGFLAYLGSLALLMTGHLFIKNNIKSNVWLNSPSSETNDYKLILTRFFGDSYIFVIAFAILLLIAFTVVVIIIANLLSKKHEKAFKVFNRILICTFISLCAAAFLFLNGKHLDNMIYTVSAQILYIGIATLGLAYIGLYFLVAKTVAWIKNGGIEKDGSSDVAYAFVLLAFLALFSISVVSTQGQADPTIARRADYMFYGRYTEPMIFIVSFIATINLDLIYKKRFIYSLALIPLIAFTFIAVNRYNEFFIDMDYSMHNCIATFIFSSDEGINFIVAECVIIAFLALCLFVGFKDWIRSVFIFGASVFSIVSGFNYVNNYVIPFEGTKYIFKDLIEEKEDLNPNAPIYYFGTESQYIYNSSFIQFLMPDFESIHYGDMNNLPDETFYAVTDDFDFLYENLNYNELDKRGELYLFTNEEVAGKNYGVEIPLYLFAYTKYFDDPFMERSSFGIDDFFMYGPYQRFEKGKYEVTFFYSAVSEDPKGEKGTFDVCCDIGLTVLSSAAIKDTDGGTFSMPFELKEDTDNVEFRTLTTDNQHVIIKKVMIKRVE